jgi:hypothetical protein
MNLTKVSRAVELQKRIDLQLLHFGQIDGFSLELLTDLMNTLSDEELKKVDEFYFRETTPVN